MLSFIVLHFNWEFCTNEWVGGGGEILGLIEFHDEFFGLPSRNGTIKLHVISRQSPGKKKIIFYTKTHSNIILRIRKRNFTIAA